MALFGKRQVSAQVTGLAWSRVVQMERQQWEPKRSPLAPPAGARNVKKHTEQFVAGVTGISTGTPNGPASGPEAGIRTYFTYEEQEWRKGRTLTAEGTDPSAVTWPDYTLDEPAERIRSKNESYQATFAAADKRYEADLAEEEWRALEPGGSYTLSFGLLGGVKKVIPARP
jgi:hypothetical protein